ncbi:hypothetical protein [Bacillus marinisedimentorum]|uniref:hypothetical protein n=1 Tax=Bacillus marinisedimentorum TaxID=1821260 RepID=UPI0007E12962|nr:hypothetical protein [Bacillus marinisedimentorum]
MSLAAGARSWTIRNAEGAGQRRTHKRRHPQEVVSVADRREARTDAAFVTKIKASPCSRNQLPIPTSNILKSKAAGNIPAAFV